MAFRSLLGSLVRGSMRCSSSLGQRIAVEEAMGSEVSVQADRLRSLRNSLFYSDGRKSPVAAAAGTSAVVAGSSRYLHSMAVAQTAKMVRPRDGSSLPGIVVQGSLASPAGRGARRFHNLRDVVFEHADGVTATLSVVIFSVVAANEAQKEDIPTKTNPYLRSSQLREDLLRERESYNKTIPDEKTVFREYMEDDQAMRARFKKWMEKYGRTYRDEVEMARRFKLFKAAARFTDAFNDDSAKAGSSTTFGLNNFSDWNKEELARLYGYRGNFDYFKMVMSYLVPQGIWYQVGGSANNKEFGD
uniref:Cathepsin propeptide inhibitor domain-containing protein n=1 Tax=Oryza punctata TaxID=4537 RepID=A0A0E0LTI6_ORYPU